MMSKYERAIILDGPKCDYIMYDYSSLYPSVIICSNPSWVLRETEEE